MSTPISVFVADDHVILREALCQYISSRTAYRIIGQAGNGIEVLRKMRSGQVPDVLLLDIRMPLMDGTETICQIRTEFPKVRVIALSMCQDDQLVIRMIRFGASAYLRKDAAPSELYDAIERVFSGNFHYNDMVSAAMYRSVVQDAGNTQNHFDLNDRQVEFLRLASTELTYKEVADKMNVSPRTVDGYRDELFEKLGVRSRVGLVLFAIRNGFVAEEVVNV